MPVVDLKDCQPKVAYKQTIRGQEALELIRQIATGNLPADTEIPQAFIEENIVKILAIQAADGDEFAGLWITKRSARIAELEDIVERINDRIAASPFKIPALLIRTKIDALRAAAEELGQLPAPASGDDRKLTYSVQGINAGDLR